MRTALSNAARHGDANGNDLPAYLAQLAELAEEIAGAYNAADDIEMTLRRALRPEHPHSAEHAELYPEIQVIAAALYDAWQRLEQVAAPYLAR